MSLTPIQPKVLLWGAKSKARIIAEMLKESGVGIPVLMFDHTLEKPTFETSIAFTNDTSILKAKLAGVTHYVTCIGGEYGYARCMTSQYLEKFGLKPLSLIHDESFIEPTVKLGQGSQIMPRSVIHKFVELGDQVIVNTNATIDHECVIGKGVHIMGSAAITGKVTIGDYATIGTNSTILPFLRIGEGSFVGAGALVTKDVAPYTVVAGVPAKFIRTNELKFSENILKQLNELIITL
jgi:sugar O-acyltransferase (sialic acid O-acetyltransferase NeuD family)